MGLCLRHFAELTLRQFSCTQPKKHFVQQFWDSQLASDHDSQNAFRSPVIFLSQTAQKMDEGPVENSSHEKTQSVFSQNLKTPQKMMIFRKPNGGSCFAPKKESSLEVHAKSTLLCVLFLNTL